MSMQCSPYLTLQGEPIPAWEGDLSPALGLFTVAPFVHCSYPRMPGHYYPMLEMMTFCPGANSVTNYGAVGDGSTPNEGG